MANCKPGSYTWGIEQRPGFIFVRNYVITRIYLFTIPQVLYLNHKHINERSVTVRSQQVNFYAVQIGLECVNNNSRSLIQLYCKPRLSYTNEEVASYLNLKNKNKYPTSAILIFLPRFFATRKSERTCYRVHE